MVKEGVNDIIFLFVFYMLYISFCPLLPKLLISFVGSWFFEVKYLHYFIFLFFICRCVCVYFSSFFFFMSAPASIWNFPGQGSNRQIRPAPEVYTTAMATLDSSIIYNLCHSLQQSRKLNPLSKVRGWTQILTETTLVL